MINFYSPLVFKC